MCIAVGNELLSVFGLRVWGAIATIMVAIGVRNIVPKLSDSLVNNPFWVNDRVRNVVRKQPLADECK